MAAIDDANKPEVAGAGGTAVVSGVASANSAVDASGLAEARAFADELAHEALSEADAAAAEEPAGTETHSVAFASENVIVPSARPVSISEDEAAAELRRYSDLYPIARMLNAEQLETDSSCLLCGPDCPCMRLVCEEVLKTREDSTKMLKMSDGQHMATARYVEVDGEPRVILFAQPFNLGGDPTPGPDNELIFADALTGVYNRRFYEDHLAHQRIEAGVAVIDLDDFKLVNDTLGHHVGDSALKVTVEAVRSAIREDDVIVRTGGDEFVLVMPDIAPDSMGARLREVARRVSKAEVPGYPEVRLSISIGATMSAGSTIDQSVRRADRMMYQAKEKRGSVVTDSDVLDAPEQEKPHLLIVDDSEMNREILREMLQDNYTILEAEDGERGIEQLQLNGTSISIVLLDIVMPGMSGFDVLARMNKAGWLEDIPVIMISSEDSDEVVLRAFEMGASDYIARPFDARVVRHRVSNTMRLYARQRRLTMLLSNQYYEREKDAHMLIEVLAGAMELRNGESGAHVRHLDILTDLLLERLVQKTDRYNLDTRRRRAIAMASALHDIGKMAIPDEILNKPGKLTREEFEVMKTHTTAGADMLDQMGEYEDSEIIRTARVICRWHHERWDGRGYPDGLAGDSIPIEAQVVSIADVYDALTSERVYKPAYSHEKAIEMICNNECGVFNPLLLECLLDIQDRIQGALAGSSTPPSIAGRSGGVAAGGAD